MKFGQKLQQEAIPEWREKYINYDTLKRDLKTIPYTTKVLPLIRIPVTTWRDEKLPVNEQLFFKRLESERLKIDEFYRDKEDGAVKTKLLLMNQIITAINYQEESTMNTSNWRGKKKKYQKHTRKRKSMGHLLSELVDSVQLYNSDKPSSHDTGNYKYDSTIMSIESLKPLHKITKSILQIKKALMEFYRTLLLLSNYQKLNYTAFIKILKKYDKITGNSIKQEYLKHIESESKVFSSRMIETLISEVEYIYSTVFAEGDRHSAMRKLRLPDYINKSYHTPAFIAGITGGICLVLWILVFLRRDQMNQTLLRTYIYMSLPFVMAWLFCVLILVWNKFRIDYEFIFELNARNHLTLPRYANIVGIFSLIFTLLCTISLTGLVDNIIPIRYHCIIILAIIIAILCIPFHGFYHSSRRWIGVILVKMILPFVWPVRFRDFLLGDILMSLGSVFKAFYLMDVLLWNGSTSISPCTTDWYLTICQIIPCYVRSCQCIRRYLDARGSAASKIHITNLVKYLLNMTGIIFFNLWIMSSHSLEWTVLWMCIMSISTIFSLYWDLVMDWGLVQHRLLREHLVYKWPIIYYLAIITNIIARCCWILIFALKNQMATVISYLVWVEVLRRFQWIFFRVEHEHLNNCGELRAFHNHLLPYQGELFTTPNVVITPEDSIVLESLNKNIDTQTEKSFIPIDIVVVSDDSVNERPLDSPETPTFKKQAFLLEESVDD